MAAQNLEIAKVITKTEQNWSAEIDSEDELFVRAALTPDEITVWRYYQRAWWGYFREMIANLDDLTPAQLAEIDGGLWIMYRDTPPKVYFNSMESLDSPGVKYVQRLLAKQPASSSNVTVDI